MSTIHHTADVANCRFQTFEALDTVISDVQATLEVLFDAAISDAADIPDYYQRVIANAKGQLAEALPLLNAIRRNEWPAPPAVVEGGR